MDSPANRRAILLTAIGSGAYGVLKDFSFPDAPNTKTFLPACNAVVWSLRAHALVSGREIPIFRKPETEAKHRGM